MRTSIKLLPVLGAASLLLCTAVPAVAGPNRPSPSKSTTHQSKPRTPAVVKQSAAAAAAPSFGRTLCWSNVVDGERLGWAISVLPGQAVVASATEANPLNNWEEFIGDAHVYAENVAVVNGRVMFRVRTNWGAPVGVCVHLIG